jgi:TonB family protein
MKRLTCVGVALLLSSAVASAQDSVRAVRDLYAAASYEEALALINRVDPEVPRRDIEPYRVFSLTALGRTEEATKAMEALILADPAFALDPAETPPRVQEAFREVQQRLLPAATKQLYLDARASLEQKNREEAIVRFEKLLTIIDAAGGALPSIAELRLVAEGFLDLSRALAAPPVATPDSNPTAPATTPATASPVEPRQTRPVVLSQELPPWFPSDSVTRRTTYSGSVRVHIGADGRVDSAAIVKSVHPAYDAALLRAARSWLYTPATREGVPQAADITVEIQLEPR